MFTPLSSNRQHYHIDDCLEDNNNNNIYLGKSNQAARKGTGPSKLATQKSNKENAIHAQKKSNRQDYSNYHYVNFICTRIMEFLQFSVKLIFCVSVKVKLSVYCKV